jgi:alpha-L-arabinofuranosidase
MQKKLFRLAVWLCAGIFAVTVARAQNNLSVYADALVNGFQDWGWATHSFANTSPVHTGANSVSITIATTGYDGLQICRAAGTDLDSSPYTNVSFWINGGASGGQQLQVFGLLHVGGTQNIWQLSTPLANLQTNTWQQITIPLSTLGVANKTNFTGIVIQSRIGAIQPTFYLDDIQLNANPPPALVHLGVNATNTLRAADARWFGLNTAIWDSNFDTTFTANALAELGTSVLRGPGGSTSDEYHWVKNSSLANTWQWATSFAKYVHIATNAGSQAIITVNYGTGTSNEAAAWVAYANSTNGAALALGTDLYGTNWFTTGYWSALRAAAPLGSDDGKNFLRLSRTAPLGFKYWEVGNENYGTWETDTNNFPHDPFTYAVRAAGYITQMKQVDPTIKIGIPVVTGEDANANGYSAHPALNPRTSVSHNGWTPVVLATMKALGVTPDFIVHHVYPQFQNDSDAALLQASVNWATDAANLRQMITDYVGTSGTNIEILCTENNADAGTQGRQSTSIVNGLYLADSLAQLMKTEINAFIWWDLRNGQDAQGAGGDFNSSLYGWRTYGDLGIIGNANTRYPTFYGFKLMQFFARPGDTILNSTSDYNLLSSYASRKANGALALLVINKNLATNLTAQIALTNFSPSAIATVRSFGITQDEATRTNSIIPGAQDIATNSFTTASTNFTTSFPPYSLTLFTFSPAAPKVQTPAAPAEKFIFQLQGQTGVPYQIQTSTNLFAWASNSTVTLTNTTWTLTNNTAPGAKFWRAVWLP